MPNRLAQETSPYLLQHADNPVDWYPWGEEAFQRARAEQKPVFLSVGYSACHWCHVMERESFSDPETAALLNRYFVPVKVDREERPDVDQLYMQALQVYHHLAGQPAGGGWPLSMFLTPEGEPFLGGTYWPPEPRYGMPSFRQVLQRVAQLWQEDRPLVEQQARQITEILRQGGSTLGTFVAPADREHSLDPGLLEQAAQGMERAWDPHWGGFGPGPKFPHPLELRFLLRLWHRTGQQRYRHMVTLTLDQMARGGIYDHLGGGFHRYSVDGRWQVPHFEKMLYDNAMLATAYLEAYQATGNPQWAAVARETLDYLLRDMRLPQGAFAAAQDADSQGREGAYYVWTPEQIEQHLDPEDARLFCYVYDVTPEGNFEGHTVLHRPKSWHQAAAALQIDPEELQQRIQRARHRLLQARQQREAPLRDQKVLLGWNALAVEALATAAQVLQEPRYYQAALDVAQFVDQQMQLSSGELVHSWSSGRPGVPAFLDDVAGWAWALLVLYQADWQPRWLDWAGQLADQLLDRFHDAQGGGFFYADRRRQELVAPQKDITDNPTPSGNALAAGVLLRLGHLLGSSRYLEAAAGVLQQAAPAAARSGLGYGQLLLVLDEYLGPSYQLFFLGQRQREPLEGLLADLAGRYAPRLFTAGTHAPESLAGSRLEPVFQHKRSEVLPALFVCQGTHCEPPVQGAEAILARINQIVQSTQSAQTADS